MHEAGAPARRNLGEVRAPRTPLRNLENPYATGRMEVSPPTAVMSRPRALSSSIVGAVKASEFLVR